MLICINDIYLHAFSIMNYVMLRYNGAEFADK